MTRSYYPPGGTLVGLVVVAVVGYAVWKLERAQDIVSRWFQPQGTVSTKVSSFSGTEVMRTPGGLLEVARIKAYERITRDDPRKIGNWADLGTTVSEVDVVVLFRYHIEIAKEWPIACTRGKCVVRAGPIIPSLPPAIYSDETKRRTSAGWARFNKGANLAALERSLTAELSERARTERNMRAATEAGRRTVQEFVRTWMAKTAGHDREVTLVVLFPGETEAAAARTD